MGAISTELAKELSGVFSEIHSILLREGEGGWIRGINSIMERLGRLNYSPSSEDTYKEIQSSYRCMNSGAGSFSGFMIWRDNIDERRRLNKEFDELTAKAWKLLDL